MNSKMMGAIKAYEAAVFSFTGKTVKMLVPPTQSIRIYYRQLNQAERLVEIVEEFKTTMHEYLQIQFEALMPIFGKKKLGYVPFPALITDGAVKRFSKTALRDKIFYDGEKSSSVHTVNEDIADGVGKLGRRLEIISRFSPVVDDSVESEIELLSSAGVITPAYVFVWMHRHLSENLALQAIADDYKKRHEALGAEKLFWVHRKIVQDKGGRFARYL